MNANQLTKIPLEKLSGTLLFLIAENEIPLSDALKQVIDDVDAVCKKLLRDEPAPAQPVIPERQKLRYGDNVLWFLDELAAFDASDIDSDDFDVYVEDRNGTEGCATISITELAADAAKLLSAQPVSEPYKLSRDWIEGQFAYQNLFNAIAAVVSKHPNIEISIKALDNSMLAAAPAQESE